MKRWGAIKAIAIIYITLITISGSAVALQNSNLELHPNSPIQNSTHNFSTTVENGDKITDKSLDKIKIDYKNSLKNLDLTSNGVEILKKTNQTTSSIQIESLSQNSQEIIIELNNTAFNPEDSLIIILNKDKTSSLKNPSTTGQYSVDINLDLKGGPPNPPPGNPYAGPNHRLNLQYNIIDSDKPYFEILLNKSKVTPIEGRTSRINSTVTNTGTSSGTDNITLDINGTTRDYREITLASGESTDVTFSWNTNMGIGGANFTAMVSSSNESKPVYIDPYLKPLAPSLKPPLDLDNDGLYHDADGDGDLDVIDVQVFFMNRKSKTVSYHQQGFDFSGDGYVNVGDPQSLFRYILG